MNGHILPGTPIAVDFWLTRGRQSHYIHFLSHIHGDHIVGLTSTWMQPIYCSALTAEILHIYYGISKLLLCPVPLNQPVTIHSPYSDETFSVTAFDANHCPGALMFFFQGDFGNIFYTGDFRYSSDVMSSLLRPLHRKIDTLYMDNTFCSPLCNFPSKEECLAHIIDIVKQHHDHDIIIGVRKLGKEDLLVKLGLALEETIYASPKQLSVIQHLYSTNIFASVSDAKEQRCRIRTVPFHQVSSSFVRKLNEATPTIAILPSAVFSGLTPKPFSRNPDVHVIPYSDHSSFQELMEFVSQLKPSHIVPVVNSTRGPFGVDISDRQDMSCFKPFLNPVNRSYGVNCNGPKSFADVTRLESISLADFSSSTDNGADSCSFSPNYLSNVSAFRLNSSITCNSHSRLKRKISGSSLKKRKIARGVCYVDDDPPKYQNDNNTFGLHDYEGNIEESMPSKCPVNSVKASTRVLFSSENNEDAFIQNVSSSSDNEETENTDDSFKLQKHHDKLPVKEKTIEISVCENDHHSSLSYSQNRKTCANFEENGCQLEFVEAKICCSSLTNSKKLQYHNVAKSNSNFPDACHAAREPLCQNIDILKALRENNGKKKQKIIQNTNKSIIACLKSVIKRWETKR